MTETRMVEVKKTDLLEISVSRLPASDKVEIFVKSSKIHGLIQSMAEGQSRLTGAATQMSLMDSEGTLHLAWNLLGHMRGQPAPLNRCGGNFPPRLQVTRENEIDLSFLLLKDLDTGVSFTVQSQLRKESIKDWMLAVKEGVQKIYEENMKPIKYKMLVSVEEVVGGGSL